MKQRIHIILLILIALAIILAPQTAHADDRTPPTPLSPIGTITVWSHTFHWTGLEDAQWYLININAIATDETVLYRWISTDEIGPACSTMLDCTFAPPELDLPDGDYTWQIVDYGPYGYGTTSDPAHFTLTHAGASVPTSQIDGTITYGDYAIVIGLAILIGAVILTGSLLSIVLLVRRSR